MIFETHAHYEDEKYDEDRDRLIPEIHANGVDTIVDVASSIETTKKCIELAGRYDFMYASVGVHPEEIDGLNEETFLWLKQQTAHAKVKAVGEIGLDYYWVKDEEERKKQCFWFKRQMELAREVNLPVIIHSRDAASDTMECMKEVRAGEIPGVIHCYSYSPELALEFIKMGYYIGVGGVVTFKNSKKLKETVKNIPLSKILLETDAPYMAPEPNRGKRNRSDYIVYVAETIAALKNVPVEEVYRVTTENAKSMYRVN